MFPRVTIVSQVPAVITVSRSGVAMTGAASAGVGAMKAAACQTSSDASNRTIVADIFRVPSRDQSAEDVVMMPPLCGLSCNSPGPRFAD